MEFSITLWFSYHGVPDVKTPYILKGVKSLYDSDCGVFWFVIAVEFDELQPR